MVWENVPGALSSGSPKGSDFAAVLTEITRIAKADAPDVSIPKKWTGSGAIMGDGDSGLPFSIAWRVHDAQFWGTTYMVDGRVFIPGTPQRRKRIALVADFNGLSAPEILFERKSLYGDLEQGIEEGEGTPGRTEASPNGTSYTLKIRGGREIDSLGKRAGKGALIQTELSGTLGVSQDQTLIERAYDARGNGGGETVPTITGDHQSRITDYTAIVSEPKVYDGLQVTSKVNIQNPKPGICHTLNRGGEALQSLGVDIYNLKITEEVAAAITANVGGSTTSGAKILQDDDSR